jgi:hypothetical protein
LAAHRDFINLHLIQEENIYGETKVVCTNAIPCFARKHLNMLNDQFESAVVFSRFETYFNEQLQKRKIYWDNEKESFRINVFNITINDGWVPASHFKMRTPNIVTHRSDM